MWIFILSSCIGVSFIMTLIFCICWRKKTIKDEWHGPEGMVVRLKDTDENVNHLPSGATCILSGTTNDETAAHLNQRNANSNSRRSLPDIPADQSADVNWEPIDNSSEHYATLGQYQNAAKRHTIANGIEQRISISQHSSTSQNDEKFSPYERVKYDKIKSKEHPYAQLQPNNIPRLNVSEENISTIEERVNLLRADLITSDDPLRLSQSSLRNSGGEGGLDIPAASAVAGAVAASPELPYMTPPVTVAQTNFSGDSQDSSKGYTSISVREPLANIIAQTSELKKTKRDFNDPHYSTVSDDSDDVYTTIPDPNTSESETYARIGPLPITVEVEVNAPPPAHLQIQKPATSLDEHYESPPPPQPPPADTFKKVQTKPHSHSRQASSSSSIANLGSPKPEKRQANSPLPPPPSTINPNFDFHTDKVQTVRNLDDLYAKVHKTKKDDTNNVEKIEIHTKIDVEDEDQEIEHNYETLSKSPRRQSSDPGYEKIQGNNEEPGYASINGPESLADSDPGYEVLKNRTPSEIDPNYEELRHRSSNASESSGYTRIKDRNDGYSVVNKKKKKRRKNSKTVDNFEELSESDPNYESVNHNNSDPNYETVRGSELEIDMNEPPYERLDEDSSRTNSDLSGYDRIRKEIEKTDTSESSNSLGKSSSEKTDPPYEQLYNETELDGNLKSTNILDDDGVVQV